MKFFVDTADVSEIEDLGATGLVDGVTTNPSLIAKSGRNFLEVIREICDLIKGPVSAEVAATGHKKKLAEGRKLAKIADNVTVKVPLTPDGLKTCRVGRLDDISRDGMCLIDEICMIYGNYPLIESQVLVASIRSPNHVVEAAKMGADVVTVPPAVLRALFKHPLTDQGLETFLADWAETGQSIMES